jgi:hypothetical protein
MIHSLEEYRAVAHQYRGTEASFAILGLIHLIEKTDATIIAERVVRDVAELPDRTSPDDQPDMMLVTAEELKGIVINAVSPGAK